MAEAAEKANEKKTQTNLVSPGNLDLGIVITGLEFECLFKSISDGGSKNQATFDIEGYKHKFTVNGVTLGQMILGLATEGIRVRHASKVRKMTSKDAYASDGEATELAELITRTARAEADPIQSGMRAFGKMTHEEQLQFIADIQKVADAAKAKQAGITADTKAVLAAENVTIIPAKKA